MSTIYIQEPPTTGKVLLVTSVGDIDVELWAKETPKACRNFVQLCMEGYYDGTIFHRLVPEFIVQGGDPTGTGHGGESIYGAPFKDEFHTRLRFNRRGLVAMANAGPNDNGSQFFFTLGPAQELQKKHTIFGKVTGNTLFNMIKLQEVETDSDERPLFPHKIIKTEILSNPFDDIVTRALKKIKKDNEEAKKTKSKSKATKNFSLLSFGEEAEEDEEETVKATKTMRGKSKSSHDLIDDPRLSSVPAVEMVEKKREEKKRKLKSDDETSDVNLGSPDDEEEKEKAKEAVRKKLKKEEVEKPRVKKEDVKEEEVKEPSKLSRSEELRKEVRKLQKELNDAKRRSEKAEKSEKSEKSEKTEKKVEGEEPDTQHMPRNDMLAEYKKERQKYKQLRKEQGKVGASREEATLAMLEKFQSKLSAAKKIGGSYSDDEEEEEKKNDKSDEEDDPTDMSWMCHKLYFEDKSRKVIDANITDLDRYEIYDPRNPITKRRREASKNSAKDKR